MVVSFSGYWPTGTPFQFSCNFFQMRSIEQKQYNVFSFKPIKNELKIFEFKNLVYTLQIKKGVPPATAFPGLSGSSIQNTYS